VTDPASESNPHVSIRPLAEDEARPDTSSDWDDWGEMDHVAPPSLERWAVEVENADRTRTIVGVLSAHPVWYGPTAGSRAINIGIALLAEYRGRGIGTAAQRLLADELHSRGVVRVEAGTDVDNVAEQKSLERAGFTLEGTLRLAQGRRDGLHDLQIWSHVRPPAP
jgi:RimJ/RimL family protein N-acetyltransferase